MQLLTNAIRATLPPLYSTDRDLDPLVRVKFFDPCSAWTWFATEAGAALAGGRTVPLSDPAATSAEDVTFFGLVVGLERELGYFSLRELSSIRNRFGLGIERDLFFEPRRLSELG